VRGGAALTPPAWGASRTTHAPLSRFPSGVTSKARVAPGHIRAALGGENASGIESGSNAAGLSERGWGAHPEGPARKSATSAAAAHGIRSEGGLNASRSPARAPARGPSAPPRGSLARSRTRLACAPARRSGSPRYKESGLARAVRAHALDRFWRGVAPSRS